MLEKNYNVDKEKKRLLEKYVFLIKKNQENVSLIGKSTISDIWLRHIIDSLQIIKYLPKEEKNKFINAFKYLLIENYYVTLNDYKKHDLSFMPIKEKDFLKKKGMTMPILYDRRGHTMKRYNAMKLPRLFVMDGYRKITFMRRGFHEGEEEKFVKDLSEEIEKRVKALPPLAN